MVVALGVANFVGHSPPEPEPPGDPTPVVAPGTNVPADRLAVLEQENERLRRELASTSNPTSREAELVAQAERLSVELAKARADLSAAAAPDATLLARIADLESRNTVLQQSLEAVTRVAEGLMVQNEGLTASNSNSQWKNFLSDSVEKICSKTRRQTTRTDEECREKVIESMSPSRRTKFDNCLAKSTVLPYVEPVTSGAKKDFAEILHPTDKDLKEWFVVFCDPSIPEGGSR